MVPTPTLGTVSDPSEVVSITCEGEETVFDGEATYPRAGCPTSSKAKATARDSFIMVEVVEQAA
jgi:hypothetical protein